MSVLFQISSQSIQLSTKQCVLFIFLFGSIPSAEQAINCRAWKVGQMNAFVWKCIIL